LTDKLQTESIGGDSNIQKSNRKKQNERLRPTQVHGVM